MDRENVIKGLNDIGAYIADRLGFEQAKNFLKFLDETIALLKEQEKQKFFVDENGKITPLPVVVRCKDCENRECDGRAGTIVCGITGDSHSRLWFCADGERRKEE